MNRSKVSFAEAIPVSYSLGTGEVGRELLLEVLSSKLAKYFSSRQVGGSGSLVGFCFGAGVLRSSKGVMECCCCLGGDTGGGNTDEGNTDGGDTGRGNTGGGTLGGASTSRRGERALTTLAAARWPTP